MTMKDIINTMQGRLGGEGQIEDLKKFGNMNINADCSQSRFLPIMRGYCFYYLLYLYYFLPSRTMRLNLLITGSQTPKA